MEYTPLSQYFLFFFLFHFLRQELFKVDSLSNFSHILFHVIFIFIYKTHRLVILEPIGVNIIIIPMSQAGKLRHDMVRGLAHGHMGWVLNLSLLIFTSMLLLCHNDFFLSFLFYSSLAALSKNNLKRNFFGNKKANWVVLGQLLCMCVFLGYFCKNKTETTIIFIKIQL